MLYPKRRAVNALTVLCSGHLVYSIYPREFKGVGHDMTVATKIWLIWHWRGKASDWRYKSFLNFFIGIFSPPWKEKCLELPRRFTCKLPARIPQCCTDHDPVLRSARVKVQVTKEEVIFPVLDMRGERFGAHTWLFYSHFTIYYRFHV